MKQHAFSYVTWSSNDPAPPRDDGEEDTWDGL